MPNNQNRSRVWEPLLIAVSATIGLLAGYNMNFENEDNSLFKIHENTTESSYVGDGRIEEIVRFVESNYLDSVNSDEITLNAIDALLQQLDPHSSYITPDELSQYNEKMSGVYRGVGIEVHQFRDTFYVSKIVEDSPSEIAELTLGDAILKIDGAKVSGNETDFMEVSKMLKNKDQDSLVLTLNTFDNRDVSKDVSISEITIPSANLT